MSLDEVVIERPGCALHVWLTGPHDRPLLILLHGAGIDHRTFEPQVESFGADYRLALMDVRGHGKSRLQGRRFSIADARDDVLALLDTLDAETAVLLGQSMGGNIAQEVVFQSPGRVAALIAADSACNTLPLSAFQRAVLIISPMLLTLLPQRLLWSSTVSVSKQPAVRRYLADTVRGYSKAQLIEILTATLGALHPEPHYTTPCPLLIMRGEHDSAGAIRQQAPLWAARDHACYVVIPDAGHVSNMDNPEAFNRAVLSYLRHLQPPRRSHRGWSAE